MWHGVVHLTDKGDSWCHGPCIDSGYVRGLSRRSLKRNSRQGELIVIDNIGAEHTFMIVADHQYQIPERWYALVGSDPYDSEGTFQEWQFWAVGEIFSRQGFEKVSVFYIPEKKDVKRLHKLGVTTDTETFLA
ncbi:hypothetical protein ARMSODRAFT_1027813 [Armillaria solidipes]|uniref:Uncharacterized protein n=1 Tax=Armillaria solidipes TaxID=1076256 RepID=A0A2H3B528_9AGAR|nr:hypothetical protein ARMSODRAFT_1027813 [Armillaria solidipes]